MSVTVPSEELQCNPLQRVGTPAPSTPPPLTQLGPEEAARGGAQGKVVEALRQMRITHRGNYRQLLEEMLASFRLARGQGAESPVPPAAAVAPPPADGDTHPGPETPGQDPGPSGDEGSP